ncbi:MAG: T9SS type A sorting domain-containing protein [Lewinellaceae bacterium]|nr:T9SS type A sorting domain-containing protein [Lewinellaceae bacterium]
MDVSSVTTSDNCGGTVTVTHIGDVPNGTCPTTISRMYQAEDACGNTERCTQTITVEDKLKPTVTCPDNITVSCTDNVPAPDANAVTAGDNCAGTVTVTHTGDNIGPKACENRYLIIRTYEAEDACGNTASCSQGIRVDDKIPPTVTCPNDLSVSCTTEIPAADVNAVLTNDNCGGTVVTTYIGDAMSDYLCANRYRIVRMYRATDVCGNKNTCFQNIEVYDATPPSGICPKDISVSCIKSIPCSGTDPLVQAAIDSIKLAYKDNCGGNVSVTFVSNDSLETCSYEVNSGYTFSRTFHFIVSDVCGNTTSCSVSFTGACICSYTQGFWGNSNGKANGLTTSQILDTLMQQGPILVGDGTNCGFGISTRQCVLNILPAGGPSNPLAKNYVLNCNTTIKNTLVGQLIALQLNLRYNTHFRKLNLGSIILAESCALTSDQVKALGLGVDTATIQDLIERTNRFLSSNCTGETFAKGFGSLLTNALTVLNEYWHECRIDVACEEADGIGILEERSADQESGLSDEVLLAPNPAFASLTVTFKVKTIGNMQLRVFDSEGKLVKVVQTETTLGSNRTVLDVSGMAPGMYWISLISNEQSVSKRFVVYRD